MTTNFDPYISSVTRIGTDIIRPTFCFLLLLLLICVFLTLKVLLKYATARLVGGHTRHSRIFLKTTDELGSRFLNEEQRKLRQNATASSFYNSAFTHPRGAMSG